MQASEKLKEISMTKGIAGKTSSRKEGLKAETSMAALGPGIWWDQKKLGNFVVLKAGLETEVL